MSFGGQLFQVRPGSTRPSLIHWVNILVIALLVLASFLYRLHADPTVFSDDEGGYAYAAWRLSQGEIPYRDFLTPQLPLFLYSGGLIESVFGRSIVALRLATMLVMLLAAYLLFAVNRELFGPVAGLLSMGLFLVDANVFHNGRFYRPEACMLLFDLAGVYAFVLGEKRRRLAYTGLASVLFGLAIVSKLFGFLPLAGCFAYLLYAWWRERRPFRLVLQQSLALGIPALLLVGTVAAVFMHITPYFFTAVFEHHTMQDAQLTKMQCVIKALRLYGDYAVDHPLAVALMALGALSLLRQREALPALFVWQVPTVLSFTLLSRSLAAQHLTYLAPTIATLVVAALLPLLQRGWRLWGLALILVGAIVAPSVRADWLRSQQYDRDTSTVAAVIRELTAEDDLVVSDYPGFNFAAGRRTTHWAAGLSGGAAKSGQIHGAQLIDDIEKRHVSMVIINVVGQGRQMRKLVDYPELRRYVQTHFALVAKIPTGYQVFEIYSRNDTMPLKADINFHNELALTGVRLSDSEARGGSAIDVEARWQVRQQLTRDYHVSLRLVDATGHLWAQIDERLQEESSRFEQGSDREIREQVPSSRWTPQQVVLSKHQLAIGPTVPTGNYYLTARLYDLDSGVSLPSKWVAGAKLPGGEPIITEVRHTPADVPASLDTLPIAVKLQTPLAGGLELLGSGPLPTSIKAGRDLAFCLFWRAAGRPTQDYRLELRLVDEGKVLQRWPAEVAGGFATSTWREGEVVLGSYRLPVAGDLAEGTCTLQVGVSDGEGRALGQARELATGLPIKARADVATIRQAISRPLEGISFAGRIDLLGYDLSTQELRAGNPWA